MTNKIADFFHLLMHQPADFQPDPHTINLACAVLLVEVMRADGNIDADERAMIDNILQQHFMLSAVDSNELIERAIQQAEQAIDYYQFTKLINQQFTVPEKITMVELLWQVAIADGQISSIEQHIIRKIADLLYLRHNEYIQSKLAVTNN